MVSLPWQEVFYLLSLPDIKECCRRTGFSASMPFASVCDQEIVVLTSVSAPRRRLGMPREKILHYVREGYLITIEVDLEHLWLS